MKKLSTLVCLSALLVAACGGTSTQPDAQVAGPNSLALAGRNLLVATSGNAELRVLALSGTGAEFLRAPNPIYPLAVPTAPFPFAVAAHSSPVKSSDGNTTLAVAPLSFALSPPSGVPGAPSGEVSVVDSARPALVRRFSVVDPAAEPAAAALAIEAIPSPDAGKTRLVVSVNTGTSGQLRVYDVERVVRKSNDIPVEPKPIPAIELGADSVPQAIVASPADPNLIAIADRNPPAAGAGLAFVTLADPGAAPTRVDVGGAVLAVAFQPDGKRILGIHDVAACDASPGLCPCSTSTTAPCGLFIAGVPGQEAVTTISIAVPGVPRGLAVANSLEVAVTGDAKTTVSPGVVVTSTRGDANLLFYGNPDLRGLNTNATGDFAPFTVPGLGVTMPSAVEFDPLTGFFYAAFEGGNAVAQIRPSSLQSGTDSGLTFFR